MRKTASFIAAAIFALSAVTAQAQEDGSCIDTPLEADERAIIDSRLQPFETPADMKGIASHGETMLSVRTLNGKEICVRTAWMHTIDAVTLSADQRFLQFHYYALEADGHILIDRSGNGQVIATGNRPLFNKDRNYFMAMQKSGAGWGNLEGIAAWRVGSDGSERIFYSDKIADGPEYGVYRFDDSGCALIKAKPPVDRGSERPPSYIFAFGDTTSLTEGTDIDSCMARSSAYHMTEPPAPSVPEWHLLQEMIEDRPPYSGINLFFAGRKSIADTGKYKTVRISHLSMLEAEEEDLSRAITDYRARLLIDCETGRRKTLEVSEYDGFEQLVMESRLDPDMLDWDKPLPGSPNDKIIEFTCKKTHERPDQALPPYMQPIKALLAYIHADWSK